MGDDVRKRYRYFAKFEAKGVSPLYEELALAVCSNDQLLEFISRLPAAKQQPNLVFAAVRHLYGTPRNASHFAALIAKNPDSIRREILARSTQTNEPGRCATLLPAFAQLPQPLALLEVGASAGLCLLPDYYGYDYGKARLAPAVRSRSEAPFFPCVANAETPIPTAIPQIVWRQGLELNPVDISDPEQASWLETLVWPGQEARAARLRAAIAVAREAQPPIRRGNLLSDLPSIAASAPSDATLVIFHSAVLAYLPSRDDVAAFVATVRQLSAIWISNEGPTILPDVAASAKKPPPLNRFLLAINGVPVASTGPHGQSIDWFSA